VEGKAGHVLSLMEEFFMFKGLTLKYNSQRNSRPTYINACLFLIWSKHTDRDGLQRVSFLIENFNPATL
jgi:hypothetical protein